MTSGCDYKKRLLEVTQTLLKLEDNPLVIALLQRVIDGLNSGRAIKELEQEIEFTLDTVNDLESGSPATLVS